MSDYIGTRKQADEYVGSRLVEAAYLGSRKYYDAYSEVSGSLPLVYESRVEHILKNYALYGSASGAGVETENLCDCTTFTAGHLDGAGNIARASNTTYVNGLPDGSIEFTVITAWCGVHTEKFLIPTGATKLRFLYLGAFNNNQYRFCFYDSNGDFVSQSTQSGANSFTITVPNGVVSVAVGIQLSTATTYKFQKLRLYTDLDTVTAFVPFGYQIPLTITSGQTSDDYPLYIGSTKLGEEEYLDYESGKIYKRTAQRFDKSKALINYRVTSTGVQQNNSYSCSDYIEIVAGEEYKVSSRPSITNWYFYGNTKTYLSYVEGLTATAPANAKYARVNISNINGVDTFMLTVSTEFPESYIPYYQPTDPPVPFPAIQTHKGTNTLSSTEEPSSVTIEGRISESAP